ncbi:MAG: hypothetical protein OXI11_11495, partial [Gammaproteobacteria bacterium]|nr:hypothetical protein [Gammaproteobacteria bacterium]
LGYTCACTSEETTAVSSSTNGKSAPRTQRLVLVARSLRPNTEAEGQGREDRPFGPRSHAITPIASTPTAIRRSGDPAIRRSGDPAIRRSN